jgi:hypothetical protein
MEVIAWRFMLCWRCTAVLRKQGNIGGVDRRGNAFSCSGGMVQLLQARRPAFGMVQKCSDY